MVRADQEAARHDTFGEITAAVNTPSLGREIVVTLAAEHHLHAVDGNRDHVARADVSDTCDSSPRLDHAIQFRSF